jgi:hypothetical protein
MKNLIQYRYSCEDAMFEFLKNGSVENLIEKLNGIENYHREEIECTDDELGLWFKFGNDNTLVSTIDDIRIDLSNPIANDNRKLLIDKMKMIINLKSDTELIIYFS